MIDVDDTNGSDAYTAVSKLPHYNPFLLVGLALFVIGAGLYTTFTIHTSEGKWIGFQILVGVGFAFIVQVVSLSRFLNVHESQWI